MVGCCEVGDGGQLPLVLEVLRNEGVEFGDELLEEGVGEVEGSCQEGDHLFLLILCCENGLEGVGGVEVFRVLLRALVEDGALA
jgi:hypothetical protein